MIYCELKESADVNSTAGQAVCLLTNGWSVDSGPP